MAYRKLMYVFLALVTTMFLCSAMPVMAKSGSDAGMQKSGSATSKSKKSSKKKATAKKKSKTKKTQKTKTSARTGKKMTRVNINTASATELTELVGVGPKIAKNIVAYRKKHGKFKKADDLLNVKGIGEKPLEKMKSQLDL